MLKKIRWNKVLQYVFFLAIAVFFLWLASRKLSIDKMMEYVRDVHLWPLLLVFVVGISSHYMRARRWRMLIEPLGYKVDTNNTFLAIMIGYLVNLATPRMGEIARCAVLAKYEKVPADKLAGTMLVERAFDFLSLIVVLLLTYIVEFEAVNVFLRENIFTPLGNFFTGQNILIAVTILMILVVIGIILRKRFLKGENKFTSILKNIISGIGSITKMKNPALFILYTIAIWTAYWFMTYLGFYAFDDLVNQSFGSALSVLTIGSFGFVIPTPQGAGSFQAFVSLTLQDMYGVEDALAFAYANVSWVAQTIVLLTGGFLSLLIIPYYNRNKNNEE